VVEKVLQGFILKTPVNCDKMELKPEGLKFSVALNGNPSKTMEHHTLHCVTRVNMPCLSSS